MHRAVAPAPARVLAGEEHRDESGRGLGHDRHPVAALELHSRPAVRRDPRRGGAARDRAGWPRGRRGTREVEARNTLGGIVEAGRKRSKPVDPEAQLGFVVGVGAFISLDSLDIAELDTRNPICSPGGPGTGEIGSGLPRLPFTFCYGFCTRRPNGQGFVQSTSRWFGGPIRYYADAYLSHSTPGAAGQVRQRRKGRARLRLCTRCA